ncbi:MAG: tetratricopeptide repeat protein [Bacteroidetes bacterium]|nr:tetratricopeptide repeat protein [Bacteroidota bacterium]
MDRISQLLKFLENEPDDPFLNYALAMEWIGKNDDKKATELLEKLIENHPEYSASYYHLGAIYQRRGNKDLAEKIYRSGIEITRRKKEQHQLAELQSALNNMLYDEEF